MAFKAISIARGFTHGKPAHFVVIRVVFIAVFALAPMGIVQAMLDFALR